MRAGRLNTPATLAELNADLVRVDIDWLWCGIQTKELTDSPFPNGLRNPAKVTIRTWWDERIRQGLYLEADGRLFHIDSARDFTGQRAELAITATEFVGEDAEYRPQDLPPKACRAHLTYQAPYRDEIGQATEYKTRAEVALIEAGRIQVDDQLFVHGELYNVIAYAADTDDGIVRGLWLEAV